MHVGNGPADTHSIATVRVVQSRVRTAARVVSKSAVLVSKPQPDNGRVENNSAISSESDKGNIIANHSGVSGSSGSMDNYFVHRVSRQCRPTVRV